MKRRRVLTVVDSLRRGAVARALVTLHGRLSRSRFDLRVASLFPPSDLASELREMKIPLYELGLSGPLALPAAVMKLRRLVTAMDIDLVHTHEPSAGIAGRIAAWRKAPVISTFHDLPPAEGNGLIWRLDVLTARRSCRSVLVVSRLAQQEYARLGLTDVQVVPNCIDVEAFGARVARHDRLHARTAHGIGPQETVFLHVGRFERERGLHQLLRAFRVALTERAGLRLLLAGDGPTLADTRGLAQELSLEDAVVFLGDVTDPTLLYRSADVFVFPSRHQASGVALMEAMASGLPAVVSDAVGTAAVGTEGMALCADPSREEEFARAMLDLAEDGELRERLGQESRRRAYTFDVSRCAPRLEEIYTALLQ